MVRRTLFKKKEAKPLSFSEDEFQLVRSNQNRYHLSISACLMKYSVVIFDLDGTLLDTLDDLTDSVNHVLSVFGWPLRTRDEVRAFVGNGLRNLMKKAVPEGEANPLFEEAAALQRTYYSSHSNLKTAPYRGIMELVERLRKDGVVMAIVSNKRQNAVNDLRDAYFNGYIDIAVGETENVRRKPYPDTVIKVMELTGRKKEECLYVGDSEVDILTADNAGIDCVAVSWGFRSREQLIESGASVIVDDTEELYDHIS
jgi:phosphoglycolate phosphatase